MDDDTEAELESLVTAAVLYYERHLSQDAIARRMKRSRSSVSRLLARAKELGIVWIEVNPPASDPALTSSLADLLGLRSVHVAPGRALASEPGPILARPLASALDEVGLAAGDVAIVSWGRALASVSRHLRRQDPGVVVVPAMGGRPGDEPWFQPNEIARAFAQAINGLPRFLNSPLVVSLELADALRSEAETAAVMGMWDQAKVALVEVGSWPKPEAAYAGVDFPVDDPSLAHAVGDVAGIPYTANGEVITWPAGRYLLGVAPGQLRRIPNVIGLAGGVSNVAAAIGAARAGLIDTLVTDAPTARAILREFAQGGRGEDQL